MSQSKNLREQRAKLVMDAQAILRRNVVSADDRATFERMMDEADVLKGQIDSLEARAAVDVDAREGRQTHVDRLGARFESAADREYRRDFMDGYVRRGKISARMEQRTDQAAGSQTISYTAGAAGGYMVPAGFVYEIDTATKYYAPLMNGGSFRVIETATGAVLPFPTNNDTGNEAATLAENTQANEVAITMGQQTFGSYKYTSNIVKVSLELLQRFGVRSRCVPNRSVRPAVRTRLRSSVHHRRGRRKCSYRNFDGAKRH